MAIAYHTHTFSVPTADAADLLAGTASDKVITPDVLGPVTAAGKALLSAANAGAQRAALDLEPGTDVQAYDADLSAIAALAKTDGNIIVGDGSTWTVESGATARASLGLTIGTDVQAYDADLAALAGLTSAANKVPYFTGSATAGLLDFIDDDTMATASATNIASAESVTTYVDARALVNVTAHGADGGGVTNNDSAFAAANTAGGLFFIPKPATSYAFSASFATTNAAWLPDPSQTWAQLTDSGLFDMRRGRVTGSGNGANIWRFADRVFIGEAASKFAGDSAAADGGTSWMSDLVNYAGYLAANAQLVVTNGSGDGPYGIVAAVKTSNAANHSIGFGSHVVADEASKTGWGFIAELQRESGAGNMFGLEVAAKNKGSNGSMTPNTTPTGVYGVWLAGGGGAEFGGAPTAPSTAAIVVLKNDHTWNSGIVFKKDALTSGEAIAMSSEGDGGAHIVRWYNAAGNIVLNIYSSATDAVGWDLRRGNGSFDIRGGGVNLLSVSHVTSAVNGVGVGSAVAGAPVYLSAVGSDANIDFRIIPKGSGVVRYGTHSAIVAETVTGYITIKDSGGTSRKLAVVS